jgi:hypothetical protein
LGQKLAVLGDSFPPIKNIVLGDGNDSSFLRGDGGREIPVREVDRLAGGAAGLVRRENGHKSALRDQDKTTGVRRMRMSAGKLLKGIRK